jgi:hypothetical protein
MLSSWRNTFSVFLYEVYYERSLERLLHSIYFCFTEQNKKDRILKGSKFDQIGFLMTLLGPSSLLISLSSIVIVFLDMDSIHVLIPLQYSNQLGTIMIRIFVQAMAELEMVATSGQMHLVLISLIIHTKSTFEELAVLERNALWNGSGRKALDKARKEVFHGMNELTLYSLANYFFTVVNQDISFAAVFIIVSGFGLEVAANYMILQMYDQFPLYLYIFVCLIGVVFPTIISLELPKAGETYDAASKLLSGWKGKCRSRKSLRYKRVVSFRPIGYTMGGFFTFKRSTVTTFVEALMDYTIDSILSL